jgi:hypothetical protein
LPNRLLNAFCVFAFLAQKTSLAKLSRQKREVSVNVQRLGEGPEFETRQPEPKLNKRSNANTSFTG